MRRNKYNQEKLVNTLRQLLEQHVMWTRSFIISTAADLGDLDFVASRLMKNPTDMANVLAKYYGQKEANTFKDLFTEHLSIAGDLVNAAKEGDTRAVQVFEKKWYANADDIASYFANINPYWSKSEWRSLLYDHLKMTEQEAVNRLNGNYKTDIGLYDLIEKEALEMADYMAQGISRQFSRKGMNDNN